MTPYTCPVCGGRGMVPSGFYGTYSPNSGGTSVVISFHPEMCRSCRGHGVLWEPCCDVNQLTSGAAEQLNENGDIKK